VLLTCAWKSIAGMATVPMAENPVKNLPASTHPAAVLLPLPPPPKKRYGMGTSTYINAVSMGHQLDHRAHPCTAYSVSGVRWVMILCEQPLQATAPPTF
jgi:hypothetical protein